MERLYQLTHVQVANAMGLLEVTVVISIQRLGSTTFSTPQGTVLSKVE
jgi:hypothetical protein